MQPTANTLAPELPAREAEPAPPITDTPPKERAETANQVLLPKALVDDVYREARKNFALIPDMTFALTAGARAVRDTWEHKDGKFHRKEKPFANYVPPKNDLLRAVEASRASTPSASPEKPAATTPRADAEHATTSATHLDSDLPAEPTAGESTEDHAHRVVPLIRGNDEEASARLPAVAGSTLSSEDVVQVGQPQRGEPDIRLVPTDPRTGGMLRLERVRQRWAYPRPQYPGQRIPGLPRFIDQSIDSADPDYGWDNESVLEVLKEQSGRPDLTPELLQMLSSQIYEWDGADFSREGINRKLGGTWAVIAVSRPTASGYQAVALYHRGSDSVVIINRGTEFSKLDPLDPGSRKTAEAISDLLTDREIFWKENSTQLTEAQTFFFAALQKARGEYSRTAQFVLTGHSLGGALAQAQLAAAYEVTGLDVVGVTFAALGAREAIKALPRRRAIDFAQLQQFADDRLVNYVRAGDGFVERSVVGPKRPPVLGRTVQLKGIAMPDIESRERDANLASPLSLYNLFVNYQDNHDLRSFYHRDFTLPLRKLARRRGRPI